MFHELKRLLLALPGFERFCRRLTREHVRVIMYHRFVGEDELGVDHMTAGEFEQQVAFLAAHHSVITPRQQVAALRGEIPMPPAPVVLTIDDGYRDFYELAYPILRRHGATAVFFPATGFVDGRCWMWWDQLAFAFRSAAAGPCRLQVGDRTLDCVLDSRASRLDAWSRLSDLLIRLPVSERDAVVAAAADRLGVRIPADPPPEYAAVAWSELAEMQAGGIAIGGHTVTHPILSRVPPEAARREIEDSRRELAARLGAAPDIFCFPQGGPFDFTPEIKRMVAEAGFDACYVSFPDFDQARDLHVLPRYAASRNYIQFRWVMCGGELFVLKLRKLLHTALRSKIPYWAAWKPRWD